MTRFYFFFLIALIACFPEQEEVKLRAAVGDLSELIIVGPKNQLQSPIGDTIVDFFTRPFPAIPQAEATFDTRYVYLQSFNKYEQGQANIIFLSIGDKEQNREGRVTQTIDRYATGQKVYTIYAPNPTSFYKVFNEHKETILKDLNDRAIQRSIVKAEFVRNSALSQVVNEKFDLDIAVPEGFYLATEKENILSFKRTRERRIQYQNDQNSVKGHGVIDGIVIYRYNYLSDSTLSLNRQVEIRDSVMAEVVLSANAFPMRTEDDYRYLPELETIDHNGKFANKMRGLWRFDNPISGGPFVSLNFFHEKKQYMVGIDAYVFAPNFKKRNYIREIEGIVHSASIIE